ncbi:MAG: OmpA family protein [Candidatus Aminicenantes bacterium]|nr:OmpA family protein [Candidatus Aminicenantes bacterium]NIM79965.1 OmpA family protein [Candidatus Aminicenantes bacterium]NIN19304.1 OmpA family protein [Candidatus Aminicenantes bacterium]NIN43207.1 OmpA family protein [Candidatus Aminicenantes bacterium]NIN85946.1 OmpA family protein [Candidatus Aminicenantes bacterium]
MKKSTVGFILILCIGVIGILGWKYINSLLFEKKQLSTSDASGRLHTIRIGGDNYLGYWFITSPEMRKMAARKGLQMDFTDDGGAYAQRLEAFAGQEYHCIVLPVNSYLQHGARHKFPGVIAAAISESKGADGIVGFADRFSGGKINDLNDPSLKIVYTADSPSSFLLDLTIADFDLDSLRTNRQWQVQVGGSNEVLKMARKGTGDAFVLWEPDLSRALKLPGMKYIWGSDRFSGYIVDVFVFHRSYLKKHAPQVRDFLQVYFRVLGIYANNREKMIKEMRKSTDLKQDTIEEMLKKIDWYDLAENCQLQFGISARPGGQVQDGVINTIIACTDVMLKTGTFDKDPLQGNPYRITNSTILEELSRAGVMHVMDKSSVRKQEFSSLADREWEKLREIGTFRVEPITFQSWNNMLTTEGKEKVDKIAGLLTNNYPHYRIVVRGHTGPGGDEDENRKLSLERSQAVAQYLIAVHGIHVNRIRAEGLGSSQPARKKPGESMRAYRYRLSRVEFVAVEGTSL